MAKKKKVEKEKGVMPQEQEPDWERPSIPEQMMPRLDEFRGELFERFGGKKGRKKRRERIKKNPRKNWKELGLLEKRGLA